MNTRSLIATLSVCATALMMSVIFTNAGPLSPPAGPVAPTNKTLQEVEPRIAVNAANTPGDATNLFIISQAGSYYLTGNISGVSGKNGIEITVSNVTLDLNGFDLQGVAGSLDGVSVPNFREGVVIRNGVVSDWGGDGVDMGFTSKSTLRLVRAQGNGSAGLRIGASGVIDACAASGNVSDGIVAGESCAISNSTANANGGNGVSTGAGAVVVACAARSNAFTGIRASAGSHVSQSTARGNTGDGFFVGNGGVISGCAAANNGDDGITASAGATIVDNAAQFNTGDGIQAGSDSLVRGNACDSNGIGIGDGAGIHVISSDTRVEGNTVLANDRGIDVDVAGNFIIRNSASGNFTANYDVVSGNVCFVLVASTSGAVLGSSGGVSPGSIDPWANFSF